ncbi:unnamed protein product [Oikopleura dioica]|nr:unnamed protein product [Oikopleura dioica]
MTFYNLFFIILIFLIFNPIRNKIGQHARIYWIPPPFNPDFSEIRKIAHGKLMQALEEEHRVEILSPASPQPAFGPDKIHFPFDKSVEYYCSTLYQL